MTLEANEQKIYRKLNHNKFNLYTVLRSKINLETNDYFYNETDVSYTNYSPTLDSSLEVVKYSSNSNAFVDQGNGVISLKGAVLKNGWQNTLWEMSVDIQFYGSTHYATNYIGFILLTDADNPFPYHDTNASHIGWGIVAWENGYIAGTPRLQDNGVGTYTKTPDSMLSVSGNEWYTLHVKKISQTVLEVWLNDDIQNKVVYDWNELSDADNVTFGCTTNPSAPELYGSLLIRNLTVNYLDSDNIPYTMTKLCEDSKLIRSDVQNSAILPPEPTIIDSNRLGAKEHNIHNKIQYCNNVLRYTLRKCGIDFTNESNELSNKMHELIKFISQIMITPTINIDEAYSAYVNPIQLLGDKSIVQANEIYNLIAEVIDKRAGINIDFMQKNQQLFVNSCKSGVTDVDQWVAQSGSSVTRESDGSVFATTGTATGFIWANKTGTSTSSALGDYYGDCVVEMNILSTDDQYNGIMFYETSRTGAKYSIFYPPTNHSTGHYKIVKNGNNFKAYIDDVQANNRDVVLEEPYRIGVRVANGGHNIKIANFNIVGDEPVYPIVFHDNKLKTITPTTTTVTVYDWNMHDIDMSDDCIIEWDMKTSNYGFAVLISNTFQANNNFFGIGVSTDNTIRGYYKTSTTSNINLSSIWDYTKWHHCKLVKIGNDLNFVVNGVQIGTKSLTGWTGLDSMQIFGDTWASGITCEAKNFVVKSMEDIITDVNGIATCNLIGDGSGLETYSAKSRNIESEQISVIDVTVHLKTDTDVITELNKANSVNITPIGNKLDFQTVKENSDGVYCGMYWNNQSLDWNYATVNNVPISELQGKSFTCLIKDVEFEESGGTNWNIRVFQKINNGSWANIINSDNFTDGDNSVTFDVDSNATHLWVRIQPSNNNKSYHIRTGEWVLYQLEKKEEIIYENSTEVSRTSKNGSTIYDNNMNIQLPTNAEITFDIYSNNTTTGSEHRFFLMPKAQYSSGTTQPTNALFVDMVGGNKGRIGKRESNNTYDFISGGFTLTGSSWHSIKYIKTGTNIELYIDDELKATETISWIDNYSDYFLSMMRWSASGTSSIKNVTIKKIY